MKKLIAALVLLVAGLQAESPNYAITSQPPQPASRGYAIVGVPGVVHYYYWVVAIYPGGNSVPMGPLNVPNAPVLSSTNYVTINWSAPAAVTSATGYDVLRTTSSTVPSGACACAVTTNTSAITTNDTSTSLSAYTVTSASSVGAYQIIDTTTSAVPQWRLVDGGGRVILSSNIAATAVNRVSFSSAATGVAPMVAPVGSDTNISLRLGIQGTAQVLAQGMLGMTSTPQTASDTATLTGAQILNYVLTGTPTGAAAYTLPTATDLVTAIPDCTNGITFPLVVKNTSAGNFTITMTTATDWTVLGTATIAQNAARSFLIRVTSCSSHTAVLYSFVTGAF